MSDELLPYYEKELAYIKQMGSEFAKEQPKIAGRLGITDDTVEDPHVSRLIESVAYLNARIQCKLDDELPEISDSLINVLFPHYQRPIPSMSIVQFKPDLQQLEAKYVIERDTVLESEIFNGERCNFSTIYQTDLLPVSIKDVKVINYPFITPGSESIKGAKSVVSISLKTYSDAIKISDINSNKIRFYLKGQPQHINPLYELFLNNCIKVVIDNPLNDCKPFFLNSSIIKEVGYKDDESILPYSDSSFSGYRLLTEFFCFPEKFLFIDLTDLKEIFLNFNSNELNIYIYLDEENIELTKNIDLNSLQLGCTPAINLFKHKPEPITLNHTQYEYQVVPDIRRPEGLELYSIDEVFSLDTSGNKTLIPPLYGLTHDHENSGSDIYWISTRKHAKSNNFNRDDATDVFISIINHDFEPECESNSILTIESTCSNRDQAENLPFNAEQPRLQSINSSPPCDLITCITRPTKSLRSQLKNKSRWKLLSHLNLNYLSINGMNNSAESLKEILRLYNFPGTSSNNALVSSINDIETKAITAPLKIDGRPTLCKGLEVTLTIDDSKLSGNNRFLFASILEKYFTLYCSLNSFVRVLIKLSNKEGYLKKCKPQTGKNRL